MSKKLFIILIFPLILSGCLPSPAPVDDGVPVDSVGDQTDVAPDEEEPPVEEPEFLPGEIPESAEQETVPQIGELNPEDNSSVLNPDGTDVDLVNTRVFNMIVKKFEFVPSVINVKKGNKVIINITSQDEEHGFVIDTYSINKVIPEEQSVSIEFVADKAGSFDFYSNIYAGAGTSNMRGKLIVE